MASAEQVKALLQSHVDGDEERFFSVAMQLAAHEAKVGHGKLAEEIRSLIDAAKSTVRAGAPIPIHRPRGELGDFLEVSYPKKRVGNMVLEEVLESQIRRVIQEQKHADRILSHGLMPRRKLLLVGPPGTGKTFSASVLAGELGIPLFLVRLDGLITKFMGETASKLRQIFDATLQTRGVYFFDEFDAIGSKRGMANDVGEIRRVLNSFLSMIEQDQSHSLIVAATNHIEILDPALFRRFDDVLHYDLPDETHAAKLLKSTFGSSTPESISWTQVAKLTSGLSHAEITRAASEVLKEALIQDRTDITEADIRRVIKERQDVRSRWKSI